MNVARGGKWAWEQDEVVRREEPLPDQCVILLVNFAFEVCRVRVKIERASVWFMFQGLNSGV